MPGRLVDLGVAARLGLCELGRRLRGRRAPAPDPTRFRAALDRALASTPAGVVAEHAWIDLPASKPPWRDTGIELRAGQEVSWFAAGQVVVSAALGIVATARTQLWARIGPLGPIRSSSRDSGTLRAAVDGRLELGNYLPNDWKDASGARVRDDAVYRGMAGGLSILVVRWSGSARDGLAALAAAGDPLGVVASERERLERGDPSPPGWRHLWHLGETEIFRPALGETGEPALACETRGDVGILQREAPFPLRAGTELSWRWRIDALPARMREDSIPSHDYLSLAVEFANGIDLTYFWSRSLPVGAAFWCPLPNWKHREFHVVIRSGLDGLGAWRSERRDLHADALRYLGSHPGDVVRVWLIAVSVFQRRRGALSITRIRLRSGDDELAVL